MTRLRLDENPSRDLRSRWQDRLKKHSNSLCLLWLIVVVVPGAHGWEEGDDAVNVISVENMDALLGLRMVTELKSFEGIKTNETEARLRRMVDLKQKVLSISSQITVLCSRNDCKCNNIGNGYLNISCDFNSEGVIDISPGSVPPNACEIYLRNSTELRIAQGALSNHPYLVYVSFQKIKNLTVSSLGFQNLSNFPLYLEILDCQNVVLQEHSFRNLQSQLRVKIENCKKVLLKKSIFSWLLAFQIMNVPKLELVENTFSVEVKQNPELTETVILFQNVSISRIPIATFPLSAAKIRFVDCDIEAISTGAFNAILLVSVYFERTKLRRFENGAFSERTLIQNVEFTDVQIGFVDSRVLSAAAKFTIQNCRIEEVTSGAFNVSTAYLKLLGNRFRKIRRYAFEIQNWNSIIIEGNHFEYLEPDSFSAPFSNITGVVNEFSFSNNTLRGIEIDVLAFIPSEPGLEATVKNNIFEEVCHCHLETWIRERTSTKWENFYETSFCVISALLEKCYNVSKGYMNMKDYTEEFCSPANVIVCEDLSKTYHPNILVPIDLQNTERTVLGVIFLGVMCSIGIMLIILSLMWMKEKGFCGPARKPVPSNSGLFSMCSRWCNNGNLVTSNSISRINIHEYAEIQNHVNQQQKQTVLAIEEDVSDNEELVAYENKATQTLPEELTQELLQSLREKLDDPENYSEARDMIEHLYDLIKVEESCNNNNVTPRTSFILDEEDEDLGGIYEIVKTGKTTLTKNTKTRRKGVDVVSTGTRAPSPDKLSPINFNIRRPLPTIVSDYIEPRDRKSNEYCELPSANLIMPDVLTSIQIKNNNEVPKTHIYAEPLHISQRPLPTKPDQPGTSDS